MPDEPAGEARQPRPFWSGTITFGLVSIPVDLYAAVRPRRISLRSLGPGGQPLRRRYHCSLDDRALSDDEIVRGYPWEDGRFIVVSDEELEALEPKKSRDIELRRFVGRAEIDPLLVERPYVLGPAGRSTKAYHLLADTLERTGRAGIATFVMRTREYLAAIFAEEGLLQAATLRFQDELRSPEDVGLPVVRGAPAQLRRDMAAALAALERDQLDPALLADEDAARWLALAERKRRASQDVVQVTEALGERDQDATNVIDLMSLLKQQLAAGDAHDVPERQRPPAERRGQARRAERVGREQLAEATKKQLYQRAQALDIPGRSSMSKDELIEAIRAAS